MRRALLALCLAACGGDDATPDAQTSFPPGEDATRDILSTGLAVDLVTLTATATITLAGSESTAASFEIGDLVIDSVTLDGADLEWSDEGDRLFIGVPPSTEDVELVIDYAFTYHEGFMGADGDGFTLMWPYYCGNLFPCDSNPADGTAFTLSLSGVPDTLTAVFPETLTEAPSYQIAWAIDEYVERDLGTTTAGTHLTAWHRSGITETNATATGTANLLAVFDWFEQNLGAYRFGTEAGSVAVSWGAGALGGMEHHPMWHLAGPAMGSQETHAHEAAHGWFGDGVRIACWEDFVLSEGTVTYLAGRALDVVAPTVGQTVWDGYEAELAGIPPEDPVWPDSCGEVDILGDNLFTDAPYIRGAFFYRAVALRVGAEVLDDAIAAFYAEYAGKAARMTDMLRVIEEETGFDPTDCANDWLRSTTIPAVGACP